MADSTGTPSGGFKVPARAWIGVVLAILALAFIFQNREPVSINFLAFKIHAKNWVALLTVFAAGVLTGWLLSRRKA